MVPCEGLSIFRRLAGLTTFILFSAAVLRGAPTPVGLWEFDNASDLLAATIGVDLQLQGTQTAIAGPWSGNGAVRIGIGSYFTCSHGIAPNGSGTLVNRYSLLIDFRIDALGPWYCFYQTNPANANDGDCFIRAGDGGIGVGATGYSSVPSQVNVWQRLVVAVDNEHGIYRIYLDGELILQGAAQAVDGRFSLDPTLLLFADDNGEDAPIDVARVAIYDACLSAAEVAALGTVAAEDPSNHAPTVVVTPAGPVETVTGQSEIFQFAATDADQDAVRIRVDWGDGGDLSAWSDLVSAGQAVAFTHAYLQSGTFQIQALAQDARARTGAWTPIQAVSVTGPALVEFVTPPYLQNLRSNAITVMWELNTAVEAGVEFGLDATYGLQSSCTHESSGAGTEIYRCTLTGLQPGTTYCYRALVDGQAGPAGTFTTAPAEATAFSFAVWSDSQGSNHGTYAADPFEPTKSMLRHMAMNGVQFAVTAGDLAENGASYSDARQYYLDRVARLLGTAVPWFVAWGNHDAGATAVIRRFADLPSQERAGFTPGYGSYSFDYAGCHFICIDHASMTGDISNWLESDLQSAANRDARFTFLFIHVPPYCELWIDGNAWLRARLVPLMETYGVDVCFSGHTHEYSRGFLNGVYYCVTGGGSWLDFPEVLVADWAHMTVGGQHAIPGIVKPSAESGGGLINEYVRVEVTETTCTVSMLGFAPDGTPLGMFDQFALSNTASAHPPATPVIAGPSTVDVFATAAFELTSSAFADPDPDDSHVQSRWRLCRTAEVQSPETVVLEQTTGPGTTACSIATSNLWPGQSLYASVQHIASDGWASEFAAPIAIQITPDPLYQEDFEGVAEFSLPTGWTATHRTTIVNNTSDPEDPQSNTYLTWTVVSTDRLSALGANRLSVPGVVQGNSVYAESDQRSGAQIQFLRTPDFDLREATNIYLVFRSNYMQNQDSLAALEYSVDQGVSWLPVLYLLDANDVIRTTDDLAIDATATFTRVDPDNVPTADGGSTSGGTYGEHILCRPFDGLAPYIQGRVNDDPVESKRVERYRLPAADGQGAVRFRFTLVGTASWFWGIDDFSLYGTPAVPVPLHIVSAVALESGLQLSWTGPAGPYQVQRRAALETGAWEDCGTPIDAAQQSVVLPTAGPTGFYRIRLAR